MSAPPFLTAPKLAEAGAVHGFFSRAGGVSSGVFATLNAGPRSGDDAGAVAENRRRCATALGVGPEHLLTLKQIHSPRVVAVSKPWDGDAPEADAMVTATPGLALGVLAADCMPFLFFEPHARVIAAAHAGWRGALAGVLEATVAAMAERGARPDRIIAALGPCLRQPDFETGMDVVEAFAKKFPQAGRFFAPGARPDKRQFDLAGFGFQRLATCGLTDFDDVEISTLACSEAYFSYRAPRLRGRSRFGAAKARRAGASDYGRNLS
ncbi:MAG: peptidoglycan editing factor PgeF, partial [Parvularculaceae bacterium]